MTECANNTWSLHVLSFALALTRMQALLADPFRRRGEKRPYLKAQVSLTLVALSCMLHAHDFNNLARRYIPTY